ncbi:hypothetical protein P4636_09995, partial [Halalkalibacterium halodurans]|uniref:hypothetical protein n=1 Tax=Halalkalibacterium halodurans TaxID=86665 RepID=UPI002E1BA015|nr:hypothetical protein [Halalkalibacterium halodurans]
PNTVVKLFSADGSWGLPPARVGRCQAIKHNPIGLCFFRCQKVKLFLQGGPRDLRKQGRDGLSVYQHT